MRRASTTHARLWWAATGTIVVGWMLLGYMLAHWLAYELTGQSLAGSHGHGHEADHLHGYFDLLRSGALGALIVGWCAVLAAVLRCRCNVDELSTQARWLTSRRVRATFIVAPSVLFIGAEFAERWAVGDRMPPAIELLLLGVLAQLCIGYLIVVLVVRSITVVQRILAARHPMSTCRRVEPARRLHSVPFVLRSQPMASNEAGRAPPRCCYAR